MKNKIFIHVATLNNYKEIVDGFICLIKSSGLFDIVEDIEICINGDYQYFSPEHKVTINRVCDNYLSFEFPTLERIVEFCKSNNEYNILYLHTKGVSTPTTNKCVTDWVNYMLYFLVEKHDECLKKLETHSCCGVDYTEEYSRHYSGNFWWANSDYIKTLDYPRNLPLVLSERHKAEFWICSGEGKHHNMFSSNINILERHLTEFNESNYRMK